MLHSQLDGFELAPLVRAPFENSGTPIDVLH